MARRCTRRVRASSSLSARPRLPLRRASAAPAMTASSRRTASETSSFVSMVAQSGARAQAGLSAGSDNHAMALDYLDFDFSGDPDGHGSFDAIASAAPGQLAALQGEVVRVLAWAEREFG